MDKLTKERRSWNMSHIKSKNTKPEIIVRSFLHRNGFRFRLHVKDLPGKPDVVLPKYNAIIQVKGCFWHRHPGCRQTTTPSTNVEFWQEKFKRNVDRDRKTEKQLTAFLLRRFSPGSYFILSPLLSLQRSLQALVQAHFLPHTPHILHLQ